MKISSFLGANKVLVVDDDVLIRMIMVDSLRHQDIEVLEANNADEAIELLEQDADIRILVTDIEMPGSMDGLKLAHHVHDRWPPVRILVISGKAALQRTDLPAETLFLGKPFADSELWTALSQLTH